MSHARKRVLAAGAVAAALLLILSVCAEAAAGARLSPKETLGKLIMFDTNLSTPTGESCTACHAPQVGWTGPVGAINAGGAVYPGAAPGRFGNRKPPSSAYASFSPVFHYDGAEGVFVGGQFWDGRVATLADQAKGPFLNPLEQNNAGPGVVVDKVAASKYARLFYYVYGQGALDDPISAYDKIADAIAAYESSAEVNQFSSRYDRYLEGKAKLSPLEKWGLDLFNGKGNCASCHPSTPGPYSDKPLFTDYTYDNLGIPKNPQNPFYEMPTEFNPDGADYVDPGLGGYLMSVSQWQSLAEANWGKFKVPTLRNVDKRPYPWFVKAYGHNGYFKSLKEIVHFYNTRDVGDWPEPEVSANINTDELGNLGLSEEEEWAIVAFLRTLSDSRGP